MVEATVEQGGHGRRWFRNAGFGKRKRKNKNVNKREREKESTGKGEPMRKISWERNRGKSEKKGE